MKKLYIYSIFLVAMLITLGSCRKAIPPGPQGAQGEKGEPGIEGEKGPKGDDGNDGGIGNVFYSDWKYVNLPKNAGQSTGGVTFYSGRVAEDKITQEILNKGNVIVYFKKDGLVYKTDYVTGNMEFNMTSRVELGWIWLYSSWDVSDTMFRWIIIPPNPVTPLNALGKTASLDFKDYSAICEKFEIPK